MSNTPTTPTLDARYEQESGEVYLTGIQALVRLTIDQARRDARAGLNTRGFITGYPGSPLSGMEGGLKSAKPLLEKHGVRHMPAQNEELAATSLIGTQMLDAHPHEIDGVIGYWYGKGPGVDRSSDAMKHGNFAGTSKHGAVVILSGEDHEAKSSTVPYQQEFAFEHFGIPVLQPATVAEFLEFGQHAVAMSRYSGCWVALKLTGPVCDGGETVRLDKGSPEIVMPELQIDGEPFRKTNDFRFFPGLNIATERTLYYQRHAAVRAYARANRLDRITVRSPGDRIGIIAAGKTYTDTHHALRELGWSDADLEQAGIRLLKLGLLCPMEPEIVKEFARGLDDVIVIEEKRDFIERQIGRILCDLPKPPRLIGKFDERGAALFPIEGGMDYDTVASRLGRALAARVPLPEAGRERLRVLDEIRARPVVSYARRTPTYCSGCPHNTGTKLAPGQIAWGAPGCHVFATIMPEPTRRIEAVTQFGGEGMPWIGLSPFTSRAHIIQNMGDGSLFHSSYLNIRYAVVAGVTMTFKILYNGAIANTGGQPPVGARTIPQLTRLLATEGVARIILVAKDRSAYKRSDLPSMVEVRDPEDIEAAEKELEATKGVTVLIYDGQCANERRRRQKRGLQPRPTKFVLINEDVCENCGNCGEVSSCMSLHKVDTEFGKKTVIHQSSCNQDTTCLRGECPSFVTVRTEPGKGVRRPAPPVIDGLPGEVERPRLDRPYQICIPGVGGTGVITVNAILAQAAALDGNRALSFDQTGAAQKWGPVLSSLIVAQRADPIAVNNIGLGRADLYLALDLLASADRANLSRCEPSRTAAVINSSVLPTGEMIRNVRLQAPADPIVASIHEVVDARRSLTLDARAVAERLFGDYMMTNMVAVGAAYQAGLLPISAAAIEQSIRLNNVHVQANTAAFRAGRLFVHDRTRLEELMEPPPRLADRVAELGRAASTARAQTRDALLASLPDLDAETRRLAAIRIEDLIDYQNAGYARRYVDVVREVAEAERRLDGAAAADRPFTRAVVRNLHKLMAYKDEYEVARLLTQRTFRERALATFEGSAKLFFNLQPPLLRRFGMKRKIALGEWFTPVLKTLARLRFVRGTSLDPFGYSEIRRQERALIGWYVDVIRQALAALRPDNLAVATAIAELPDDIRGYEEIKAKRIAETQARVPALLAQLHAEPQMRLSA